jgi:CMP-2-keto-3-deoxyoctulosonic acid synthetase
MIPTWTMSIDVIDDHQGNFIVSPAPAVRTSRSCMHADATRDVRAATTLALLFSRSILPPWAAVELS